MVSPCTNLCLISSWLSLDSTRAETSDKSREVLNGSEGGTGDNEPLIHLIKLQSINRSYCTI